MTDEAKSPETLDKSISESKIRKLKVDLEIANRTLAEFKSEVDSLNKLRAQDQAQLESVKVSADYSRNGGVEELFEDFKKLTKGNDAIDYKLMKSRYPQMFNRSTMSIASPINQQSSMAGDIPASSKKIGLSTEPKPSDGLFDARDYPKAEIKR